MLSKTPQQSTFINSLVNHSALFHLAYRITPCLLCKCSIKESNSFAVYLCESCLHFLQLDTPRCSQCATPMATKREDATCGRCQSTTTYLDSTIVTTHYSGLLKRLLLHTKHQLSPTLIDSFCRLLAYKLTHQSLGIDIICYVPAHPQKQLKRGGNLSYLAARQLVKRLNQPKLLHAFSYQGQAVEMKHHSLKERIKLTEKRFSLAPDINIEGKRIAVIDDIVTTGSTLNALAKLLKNEGAAHCQGLAFAKTPPSYL